MDRRAASTSPSSGTAGARAAKRARRGDVVPLLDENGTQGVLQVLDKHSSATFSLRDMELLAVFARQATVAIAATRVQRDTARLLRGVLADLAPDLTDEQAERMVADKGEVRKVRSDLRFLRDPSLRIL